MAQACMLKHCYIMLSVSECGTVTAVQGRVVGGTVTIPASWPWMVRLVYRDNAARACDGVLVGNDTVLTVARCVAG